MSKKLFTPAFDVTQFRRPQVAQVAQVTQVTQVTQVQVQHQSRTPVGCFTSTPPDESAGVTKVVPSHFRTRTDVETADLLLMLSATDDKKSKKDKKDKKKKRRASEDADGGDGELDLTLLLKSEEEKMAEVIKFAAERGLTVSFGAQAHAGPPPALKPYTDVDSDFETYMAGPGNFVNTPNKAAHAQEVAAVTTDGKSLGDKKYGCMFCGSLHHLDCHQKGNDPPCLRTGAFNRFIQNFLFDYDIAPEQEWRQMLQYRVPGYRRVMAERFASLVGNTSDADWTRIMHRRSWDMRKQTFSSNAGTSRELFHQGRASEFLFFHTHGGGSSSPRPSSTHSVPMMGSPVPMMGSPVPFVDMMMFTHF